jgi:hypothetical protein
MFNLRGNAGRHLGFLMIEGAGKDPIRCIIPEKRPAGANPRVQVPPVHARAQDQSAQMPKNRRCRKASVGAIRVTLSQPDQAVSIGGIVKR